ATESTTLPGAGHVTAALRMWLQEALQIHPRLAFRSAVEAQRAFADVSSTQPNRRAGATALQGLLRTTMGEPLNQPAIVVRPATPEPQPAPEPPTPRPESPGPFDSIYRAVFPKH